ncbi:fungal specific transcription factor domain-containing protein [Colletotrichum graminicola M1.001]|uniref:Fungal specific transcription factor domain-containing protein n=1 Tax=Colletotrichum graminicola (strain M1.001 / M2 / FGSC 10212) TaxID=645133 RepID=E3Q421_COLGM|nr:fungal specific transcription factor domain-containing protein [Colletotrichum graminicola M1.001]EFQ25333.1 fungal specific transcription factor domain-containing protein [Colletotrichum graminicola M1.001]
MSALFTTTDWLSTTSTSPDAKAPQACASCRKMKRKCDKSLPACGLCTRMDRRCDYADPPPPPPPPHQQQQYPGPTADDFAALQLKLLELESRLDHQAGPAAAVASALFSDADAATAFGAVVGSGLGPDHPGSTSAQYPPDVFLDIWAFKALNQSLPRPSVDIPAEVLELLGDSATVQRAVEAYFAGTHAWLPIVSRERIHMGAALAQGGPDLAMLFLAMRLIAAAPDDVAAPGRLLPPLPEVYGAAKRFLSLLEGAGFASLMVLQAMVLVAYFEYAHAVYPAAWLTVASCVRYADFLGLPGLRESNVTLKVPSTWTELEERLRTWWAILVLDRIICLGNGKRYLSPEPDDDMNFPVDDEVWDEGHIGRAAHHTVASPPLSTPSPFSSLCRAALLAGNAVAHIWSSNTDKTSRPCAHDCYSCPGNIDGRVRTPEETAHQIRSVEALVHASGEAAALAEELLLLSPSLPRQDDPAGDGSDVSPLVLDALYGAGGTLAWIVREEGPARHADGVAAIKRCLGRLGARWRLAAEYGRMLEQQGLAFMMQEGGHSTLHI